MPGFFVYILLLLSLSSHQTTPASSLHLLTFSFVELLLSLPLWSSPGSCHPFCFLNPFREKKKVHFFPLAPFCGSWNALRILFVLGQWGPVFLKLRPQFLQSGGDWFGVKECSWRRGFCVLNKNFILILQKGCCKFLKFDSFFVYPLSWMRQIGA